MSMSWTVIIALCGLVATCGHKGPLQLPEDRAQAKTEEGTFTAMTAARAISL